MANKYLEITSAVPAIIPKGSVIKSISYDGSLTVTSDCAGLLEGVPVEDLLCYEIVIGVDVNGGLFEADGNGVMDNERIVYLSVDGTIYPSDTGVNSLRDTTGISNHMTGVFNSIPGKPIKLVSYSKTLDGNNREEYTMKMRMIPSLAGKVEFHLGGTGFPRGLFLKPFLVTC
jgi:hypothetical protein